MRSQKGRNVISLSKPLILAALFATGCAAQPEVRYISQPIPLPPQPELPAIQSEELECIGDETYRKLVKRELLQRSHINTLENLIKTTHAR